MKNKNRVGLGTFPLANVFSKVTTKQAGKIVSAFLDNGGYYIDTAPLYGFGKVEELLGKVLRDYKRKDYYIATKCGYIDVEGKTFQTVKKSCKYKDIIREYERSLQRLKIDCIDLYFIHSPDYETPFDETMKALVKLQDDGKIKEIGVSNVDLKELREYNKTNKVKFVQNRFSLVNRSIDKKFAKYLLAKNIKLVPYQPIERGQLSDKILGNISLRKQDLRQVKPDWEEEKISIISSWVKENLYLIAQNLNITIEELAISWTLYQKYVGFTIVGATNPSQVKTNLKANEVKLSASILKKINNAYKKLEQDIKKKIGQSIREFRGLNEKYY